MPQKLKARILTLVCATIILTGATAILLSASGCTSKSSPGAAKDKMSEKRTASAAAGQSNPDPRIDLNCVYERLQKPPESFHYLYTKDSSDGFKVHQEADLTPQSIDGFRVQPDGSNKPLHAVSSDPSSWQAALAGLTGISGMSGTVATFNNTSAMQHESDGGQLNGYQTVHYSIDTGRWDTTTRQMLGNFALGPGGSDKGDVWVTSEGCPVKLVLDDEMHKKDGSLLAKTHYEEAMVKK
jgi:hypothetical protein